jgi:hypothetical protein
VWANIDIDNADISEDGYELQAGVRWKLIRWFELKLQANWVSYGGDIGDDTTGEVGALFLFFKDRMGVGADWAGGGDADTSRVFLRFNFGKQSVGRARSRRASGSPQRRGVLGVAAALFGY